jgi:hypothetical protein
VKRIFAAAILGALCLSGCDTLKSLKQERYGNHNDKGDSWLSDQTAPAEVNISGNWRSRDWGNAFITQSGNHLQGYIGDYAIKGVVSGRKAYIILKSGGWNYYSVILEPAGPDMLLGSYSKSMPFQRDASWDMRLERAGAAY